MLSASRTVIGNVRTVCPGFVRVRKHVLCVGGCNPSFSGRRWLSRKVNQEFMAKESAPKRRQIESVKKLEENVPSSSAHDVEKSHSNSLGSTCDEHRRIPMMGELIQFPNDPNPYPAPPKSYIPLNQYFKPKSSEPLNDPVLTCCKKCSDSEKHTDEETAQKTGVSTGGPSCPPPPPPTNQSYTGYFLGAIALTAGGLGLAYYNGLFDTAPSSVAEDDTKEKPSRRKLPYPPTSSDLPKHVPYILIGGGTSCIAAFRSIRVYDPKAKVLMITNELELPYMRPPLSKQLWFHPSEAEPLKFREWNGSERSIFYEPNDYYIDPTKLNDAPNGGVAVARGYEVQRLDVNKNKLILTDGSEISYDKVLIATGARPKNLPIFESAPLAVREKVTLFKNVEDFERLSEKLSEGSKVAIIGGGFLGSELACALSNCRQAPKKNIEVYQLFHEGGNLAKVIPEYLSRWTMDRLREEGVKVWPETQVKAVAMQGRQVKLTLVDDSALLVDHVIVAVGSEPNTSLAKTSGLEVDGANGGFLVDAELRARSNVFVAGDVASFYDTKFGRRRVEHHDHAVVSGRLAGENMVGLNKPYTHQSVFWSDLGPKISFEAIGLIDSALETVAVFRQSTPEEKSRAIAAGISGNDSAKLQAANANGEIKVAPLVENASGTKEAEAEKTASETLIAREEEDSFDKGVLYYLRDKKVVGLLMWNVFNGMSTARKILDQHTEYDDLNELSKLFNIHDRPTQKEEEAE